MLDCYSLDLMTLLALFDSKQKKLRSELRNQPSSVLAAKQLQLCFDEMYSEYSAANSLDLRGQRELGFVMDILKQSVALLLPTQVLTTKASTDEAENFAGEAKDFVSQVSEQLQATNLKASSSKNSKLSQVVQVNQLNQLRKQSWEMISTPFGAIKSVQGWTVVKGILGFFLFAMLWFQSQFFAAFLVLVLGFGDLGVRLFGKSKKKALNHSVSVDTAQLLAAVAELVKCAEKLLTEKFAAKGVTTLVDADVDIANRLPVLLFQDLMEARYANDGDLALKRILRLPASLEDMGIRAVDYDSHNAEYFDILPKIDEDMDMEHQTAVPALLKGDQLLARGRVYL